MEFRGRGKFVLFHAELCAQKHHVNNAERPQGFDERSASMIKIGGKKCGTKTYQLLFFIIFIQKHVVSWNNVAKYQVFLLIIRGVIQRQIVLHVKDRVFLARKKNNYKINVYH